MRTRTVIVSLAVAMGLAAPAAGQPWSASRVDSHAPIGVMGDHIHEKGETMLSFRYMRMGMDGNRDGTTSLTPADVLGQFPVTPLRMPMDMYMFGVMHAPSDRVTLMGMVPITGIEMDHLTRMGGEFTTPASGIGDVSIAALVSLAETGRQRVHLNAGIGLPTGDIDVRGETPIASDVRLPYPMQLGSGTFDLRPGLTWLGQSDDWSWGVQGKGVIRFGENENDYRLGDRFGLTDWTLTIGWQKAFGG